LKNQRLKVIKIKPKDSDQNGKKDSSLVVKKYTEKIEQLKDEKSKLQTIIKEMEEKHASIQEKIRDDLVKKQEEEK